MLLGIGKLSAQLCQFTSTCSLKCMEPETPLVRPWEQVLPVDEPVSSKKLTRRAMQPDEPIFSRIEIAALLEMITTFQAQKPIFSDDFLQELETKIENLGS